MKTTKPSKKAVSLKGKTSKKVSKKALNRRKDRQFLRFALPLVSLLSLCLLVLFMRWEGGKGDMYREQAFAAAEAGDMEKARTLAKKGEDAGEAGLQQQVEYAYGAQLLTQGNYTAAQEVFLALGAYEDAPRRALECLYRQGEEAYGAGKFEEAEAFFRESAGYEDALTRLDDCRYRRALSALQAGDKELALELFTGLGAYLDAAQQAQALSVELTGQEDAQKALAMSQGVTEEQWQAMEEAETLRAQRPQGRIAAGESHGLGVTAEKTVVSAGDNTYGQCNTQSWMHVSAVAAGTRHSLALTEDGRVLAAGDNTYGQCNTESWVNVIAIAAGNFDSYALTQEGKILHCGYGDMEQTASWQGITRLFAGNSVLGALRQDGTFLCTAASGQHEDWKNLSGLAVNIGWTAGLTREGTVLCNEFDLSSWTDILHLYASETMLAGVARDGSLRLLPLRPWVQSLCTQLEDESNVQELALSGSWALCLHPDGTVTAIGSAPAPCLTWVLSAE